jgi:hypothetical protein
MAVHRRLLSEDAGYRARRDALETYTLARKRARGRRTREGTTVIPVVVHVVYRDLVENVSAEQIASQIRVLNEDFNRRNIDLVSAPSGWQEVAGDAQIRFQLAGSAPDGAASTGITRTATTIAPFADDDAVKSATTGGTDAWPAERYLNIWVCRLDGILGYAQFPGGPPETDGVVIDYRAFGNTGSAEAPFDLGRTATHEIGHWLNLFHIWGDDGSGCSGSDEVDDTPNQAGPNSGVPVFPHVTCDNAPNGDMFINFMDYVDDSVMVLFTSGQVERIHSALEGARASFPVEAAAPATGWVHEDLILASGAPDAAGDPVVFSRANGGLSVFYLGTDHHIHELHAAADHGA